MERDAMNMPVLKVEADATEPPERAAVTIQAPASETNVIAMTPRKAPWTSRLLPTLKNVAVNVVPPVVVIALFLLLWEWACRRTGATLPPPSKVFRDTKQLIFDPFFDNGGIDKGLFWHLS